MIDRLATGELVGSVLDDRYTIQELIGRGGMAVVFRAWDAELHRTVAIKVLRGEADPGFEAQRRVREARALASINHPALVTLFDAVIRDESSYLVMELVDGATLRTQIAAGRVDARDVAVIAHDLADGLHAVHSSGVIHRDIKPANILLASTTVPGQRFRAKLSDFGIAHMVDATRVTTPGLLLGTASYISPEQARGNPAGAPSDVYAFGLTLLEALTGEPAYVGSPVAVVSARLVRDPEIPAWLGAEWSALLTAMTARDPAARPTAIEVAAAARAIPRIARHPSDEPVGTGVFVPEQSWTAATADLDPEHSHSVDAPPHTVVDPTQPLPPMQVDEPLGIREIGSRTERGHARRLLRPALLVAVLLLVLVAASFLVIPRAAVDGSPAAPTPAPSLPQLPAPLDADLQELLDEVSS